MLYIHYILRSNLSVQLSRLATVCPTACRKRWIVERGSGRALGTRVGAQNPGGESPDLLDMGEKVPMYVYTQTDVDYRAHGSRLRVTS